MDPADRARCADALATATPEQLREDAAWFAEIACGWKSSVADGHYRLAALALAIAHAANRSDARIEQTGVCDYLILDILMPKGHGFSYGACDLPAALAALVRGES